MSHQILLQSLVAAFSTCDPCNPHLNVRANASATPMSFSQSKDPYMAEIIEGSKNYEFRKYRLKDEVKRIWFYRAAPHSSIAHVCETLPARTRQPGEAPLDEDGVGNAEFNSKHFAWDGYDYAYQIVTVYELWHLILLNEMKGKHGFKLAPRGRVYLPRSISDTVEWKQQKQVRSPP